MRGWVEREDGGRIPLAALPRRVPHLSFQSELHLEVCRRLAAERPIDVAHDPVLVNYLFTMSARAKQLTALLVLLRAGRLSVRRVQSSFIHPQMVDLFASPVDIRLRGRQPARLVPFGQAVRFFIKFGFNRVYRLFRQRRLTAASVVRAWTDTTDRTFPERMAGDVLLVYPFLPNLRRQWRYLRRCRRAGRHWSLMGVPYGIGPAIRALVAGRGMDRRLVEAEVAGFRQHADELIAMGVRTVHTTDESDMAGGIMHAALIDAGVSSINRMHGIGIYGPNVCYSHCAFYTTQQARLYCRNGRIAAHDFRQLPADAGLGGHVPDQGAYQPVVTFLQGNWRQVGKRYEAAFEHAALLAVREVCDHLGLPLVVKLHPNAFWLHRMRLRLRHGFTLIRDANSLVNRHPIFLNLLSTAYYDFLPYGPTFFLKDDLIDPRLVFGDHVMEVRIERFHETLANFADPEAWHRTHETQRASEASFRTARKQHGSG